MQLPKGQDIVHEAGPDRERWLERAAHALYEARRAEFPEAFPLPWDLTTHQDRVNFRYLAKSAYRRSLPFVPQVLVEMLAMSYANLEGWIYPDCDNKIDPGVRDEDRPACAAQRRQRFRDKARQLASVFHNYLEHDVDTEAQRKKTIDRAGAQLMADQMIVSNYRSRRGVPTEVNRG